MKIKILYEDSNVLAIDKPSGIAVHSDGRSKEKTVADWVLKKYPRMKSIGEPQGSMPRPGIVHRLDRDTSGVLLLAKNQKSYEHLKKQFQGRTIKKVYNAIINGWPKSDKGVVNKPIGRSPSDFRRYLAGRGARGEMREAVTEYKVINRFESGKNKFSFLEVSPKTGRTHQIRVHMKFLNYPVVCDSLYNPKSPYPKGIKRLALHAKSIQFKDLKGKVITVESPLPKEFKVVK
jgi:23S rRNA pseudouridine1911/1915/1917 synthase